MENEKIDQKIELVMEGIGEITNRISERTKLINFKKDTLTDNDVVDLKLHLGYAKNYSDLAKVKLQYFKTINNIPYDDENDSNLE